MSIRIRVATYNVHKCRGLDRRTNPDRIAGVIAALDADIIAIQEIVDARNGKPEFDQARRIHSELNGYEFCFGENRRLHGGAYGKRDPQPLSCTTLRKLRFNLASPRTPRLLTNRYISRKAYGTASF